MFFDKLEWHIVSIQFRLFFVYMAKYKYNKYPKNAIILVFYMH
jgi:hypothetical protein